MLSDIKTKSLKTISVKGGDVKHFLNFDDQCYKGFGEVYFSFINFGIIKGWKLHTKMTMNLVVPLGNVGFVFYDEENKLFVKYKIGENNYQRITVPPNIWFAFKGLSSKDNLVVNLADIKHDPNESKKAEISKFTYQWGDL